MTRPRTAPVHSTLAAHIAELGDPVDFAARRIHWTLKRCPPSWRADLIDAAVGDLVNACLAWHPDNGYELKAYVTLRIQSAMPKHVERLGDRRFELGRDQCVSEWDWTYRNGHEDIDRAIDRADLQRWADLAELSPLMRWGVETYAVLGSPKSRGRWYDAARAGIRHMRHAALTNERREDHWTRARWQRGPGPGPRLVEA